MEPRSDSVAIYSVCTRYTNHVKFFGIQYGPYLNKIFWVFLSDIKHFCYNYSWIVNDTSEKSVHPVSLLWLPSSGSHVRCCARSPSLNTECVCWHFLKIKLFCYYFDSLYEQDVIYYFCKLHIRRGCGLQGVDNIHGGNSFPCCMESWYHQTWWSTCVQDNDWKYILCITNGYQG